MSPFQFEITVEGGREGGGGGGGGRDNTSYIYYTMNNIDRVQGLECMETRHFITQWHVHHCQLQ